MSTHALEVLPPESNIPQPAATAFKPTKAMIRAFFAECDFLLRRVRYTQQMVAQAARVSESQLSRWHQVEGYDEWTAHRLHELAVRLFARAKVSAGARVILTGDPRELEILGRVLGRIESDGRSSGATPDGYPAPAGHRWTLNDTTGGVNVFIAIPATPPPDPPDLRRELE
jgi:hypothetical protein